MLLHGSGGMANAVAAAFRDNGFHAGTSSRATPDTGPALAERLGYEYAREVGCTDRRRDRQHHPGGHGGRSRREPTSPSARTTIAKAHTVFDVVALPSETPLITAARAAGIDVITGAEVIALQAAEQFERYTGVRPTAEQVAAASAISRA